jgi:hypothetical protein
MNLKIKFRESFRPFAPCVLAERAGEWFELDRESPYMLLVAPVLERHRTGGNGGGEAPHGLDRLKRVRSSVPAITHVDYSARVQTVDEGRHGPLYRVMKAFEEALKPDRQRTKILHLSPLGLIEMTRKRVRGSLLRSLSEPCPTCAGDRCIPSLADFLRRSTSRSVSSPIISPSSVSITNQNGSRYSSSGV